MLGAAERISLGMYVAAEDHECLDCFGHECGGLVDVREGVGAGPRGLGAAAAGRIDLGFHDAGVPVVHGAEDRYGAAVAARMPDEELTCATSRRCLGHVEAWAAFCAACATVSLSAKPLILAARAPGRM